MRALKQNQRGHQVITSAMWHRPNSSPVPGAAPPTTQPQRQTDHPTTSHPPSILCTASNNDNAHSSRPTLHHIARIRVDTDATRQPHAAAAGRTSSSQRRHVPRHPSQPRLRFVVLLILAIVIAALVAPRTAVTAMASAVATAPLLFRSSHPLLRLQATDTRAHADIVNDRHVAAPRYHAHKHMRRCRAGCGQHQPQPTNLVIQRSLAKCAQKVSAMHAVRPIVDQSGRHPVRRMHRFGVVPFLSI